MATPVLDLVFTYQFLKRLALPFEQWDAFKVGIIDQNGNVLRKRNTLKTPQEISAWGYFDRMVANLKKLLGKVPGGKTKIASYAAALLLLKEHADKHELNDDELNEAVKRIVDQIAANEEIANVAGAGNVAGLGVGPQGEPPANKRSLAIKKMLKRKKPNA